MTMRDPEVENRLRSMLSGRADAIDPSQVSERLSPATLQVQALPRRRITTRVAAPLAAAAVVAGFAVAAAVGLQPAHDAPAPPAAPTRQTVAAPSPGQQAGRGVTLVRGALGGRVWIPADRSGTWQFKRSGLGPNGPAINEKAKCGAFPFFRVGGEFTVDAHGKKHYTAHEHVPNCDQGDWTFYRPKFAASLPTDPHALLAVLRKASYEHSDVNTFDTGQGFLGSGVVEPAVVGNMVAALKLIPGVRIEQGVGNGAGARGESITYTGQAKPGVTETWSVIVDTDNQVIGTGLGYHGSTSHEHLSYTRVDHLGDTN